MDVEAIRHLFSKTIHTVGEFPRGLLRMLRRAKILRLPESTLKRATRAARTRNTTRSPVGPPVSSLAAGEVNLQQARIIANRYQRSDRLIVNM